MRLMLRCESATTFPTIIVKAASHQMGTYHADPMFPNASIQTRRKVANAAAFTPAIMNAVVGVGAPSYTSGAHMWNGTTATLNAKPTSNNPIPARSIGWRYNAYSGMRRPISGRLVDPVAP